MLISKNLTRRLHRNASSESSFDIRLKRLKGTPYGWIHERVKVIGPVAVLRFVRHRHSLNQLSRLNTPGQSCF
jgi:hypothetical protein